MHAVTQEEIDQKNQEFWNELCGTGLAKQLGVVDSSPESLAKFDRFYFDYYPYLQKYFTLDELKGKNVLEVGLGYGTVSQLLALTDANYHGLDIAANAVAMAKHRLQQTNKTGDVRVGSMLACPFPDHYFDYVFSIGCFHHTGDLQACVDQTYRVLKKGGKAVIMVYNKFSLRQWLKWPILTAKNYGFQLLSKKSNTVTESQRKAYDASAANEGAPETEFFSVQDIERICKNFASIKITRENFDEYRFGKRIHRLDSKLVRFLGLDLYIEVVK